MCRSAGDWPRLHHAASFAPEGVGDNQLSAARAASSDGLLMAEPEEVDTSTATEVVHRSRRRCRRPSLALTTGLSSPH